MKSTAALVILALLVVGPALPGQTLVVDNAVLGQVMTLDLAGAPPNALGAFLFTLTGLGAGTCYGSVGLCLDVLEPVALVGVVPADGSGDARLTVPLPSSAPPLDLYFQVAVVSYPGGIPTVTKTNAVQTPLLPLSSFDDTFGGNALSPAWSLHNAALAQIDVSGGELRITPLATGPSATWFQDGEGAMVYRDITGDFTCSAVVRAEDPGAPGAPPPVSYRLGGLIVRDPGSIPGDRNSAHVVIGGGDPSTPVAVEDKTTTASMSDFLLYPIAAPQGEVRIRRQGALISLYYRPNGQQPWQLLRSHSHPEFPATVQIGAMAYANQSPASLRVGFDEITFTP